MENRKMIIDLQRIWDKVNKTLEMDPKMQEATKEALFRLGSEDVVKIIEDKYIADTIFSLLSEYPNDVKYK